MQNAIIYTRVSTDEQARNGLSLKGQEDSAREYCRLNNINVAQVFCDAGESAKTANRPQLIAAIAYCSEHFKDIDYFIVWKMDRFARAAYDSAVIDANLQKLGIQLRSVTEPITDTPIGNLTKTILAGFAQFDNEVRAERSASGVKRRILEGGWPHLAPLGYRNTKDSLNRPTLIETNESALIAQWLRLYLRGNYSQTDMNNLAWSMGIRSRKGTRVPYQQTANMLRNPIYAGLVYSKMVANPVPGIHNGVISIDEHEAILLKLNTAKKVKGQTSVSIEWPLRNGFIKCAECNENITGSSPKGRSMHYPIYHCPKCRAKEVGHRVSISRERLHEDFGELLESVTPSEAMLALFKHQIIMKWQVIQKDKLIRQKTLREELGRLKVRKQRVVTLFIDGSLTQQEKKEQASKIDLEILGTELKLNEANADVMDSEIVVDFCINMIHAAPKLWRISNFAEKQLLQNAIFPEGITYNFVTGFGTAKPSESYLLIHKIADESAINSNLVGVDGIEPSTNRL